MNLLERKMFATFFRHVFECDNVRFYIDILLSSWNIHKSSALIVIKLTVLSYISLQWHRLMWQINMRQKISSVQKIHDFRYYRIDSRFFFPNCDILMWTSMLVLDSMLKCIYCGYKKTKHSNVSYSMNMTTIKCDFDSNE